MRDLHCSPAVVSSSSSASPTCSRTRKRRKKKAFELDAVAPSDQNGSSPAGGAPSPRCTRKRRHSKKKIFDLDAVAASDKIGISSSGGAETPRCTLLSQMDHPNNQSRMPYWRPPRTASSPQLPNSMDNTHASQAVPPSSSFVGLRNQTFGNPTADTNNSQWTTMSMDHMYGSNRHAYTENQSADVTHVPVTQSAPMVDDSGPTVDHEDDFVIDILLLLMLGHMYNYYMTYLVREPVYEDPCRGHSVVHEMIQGHWKQCYTTCRMYPNIFQRLCNVFRERGLLESSRHVSLEEQMRIFLQTLAHNQRNSNMCDILHHSSQTVSKHFNRVLNAVSIWACDMIKPRTPLEEVPSHVRNYACGKYWPYFRGCVGAIDGTHVSARVPKEEQLAYRSGRDAKRCTQNVLAICDFDMCFTFVVAGWEGTAHDAKILSDAIHSPANNFPMPPRDKYYLVDAGFPNRKGFLAPFKNVRYHVPEFQRASARGKDEQFNKLHSSLRNVIERSFGLLKRRWSILNDMPPYSYVKQVKIVVACMTLHNFLVEMRMQDEMYEDFADEEAYESRRATEAPEEHPDLADPGTDSSDMATVRDSIRDDIARARGYL